MLLIPISAIFIHQLSKQWTNDIVGGLYLSITLWVINGQGCMSYKKCVVRISMALLIKGVHDHLHKAFKVDFFFCSWLYWIGNFPIVSTWKFPIFTSVVRGKVKHTLFGLVPHFLLWGWAFGIRHLPQIEISLVYKLLKNHIPRRKVTTLLLP